MASGTSIERPEERPDWTADRWPWNCLFYEKRDCPGCIIHCSRFMHLPNMNLGDERMKVIQSE
jgi:hypothetical protein